MNRRQFIQLAGMTGAGLAFTATPGHAQSGPRTTVSLVRSSNRATAIPQAVALLGINPVRNRSVILKPNFNSADPFPGSTHNDTLEALVKCLDHMGAGALCVADRSGMGNTRTVMRQKGIFDLATRLDFETLVLDELPAAGWADFPLADTHWNRGVLYPRRFVESDSVVQTCCLKTHRFGGHFTLALKNSVGIVARTSPIDGYDFMGELHNSPHIRRMIAEINLLYRPDLILLDGIEAFVAGGPDFGTRAQPGVIVAGTDPVAVDAVGVAILRSLGTTSEVSQGAIFNQDQIRRAVELDLGVASPEEIETVVADDDSSLFAQSLVPFLNMTVRSVVRPQLTIRRQANAVEISWVTQEGAGRRLLTAEQLPTGPGGWTELTTPPFVDGAQTRITVPLDRAQAFFRLE
jgi:uncharacterized protein (DUF362 family)